MALKPGTRLGPYEILVALGAGGMGEVYKARDTRLERTVAIKVLPEHLSRNEEVLRRFEREAKTISQLSHPHICALHDVGRQDGVEYLVMEYLEGETLADRLVKGPLPLEQTLRYGIEIAGALEKAHRLGIVHRDLKPGNVMLTKSGVKLLDFGLASWRPVDAFGRDQTAAAPDSGAGSGQSMTTTMVGKPDLTREGTILGTLSYMAPEQLDGTKADSRTDIFAFGATLYEMATGKKAFPGTGHASVISAIMTAEPPPISTVQAAAPPALDQVVKTCLAKDPDSRWQSAADVGLVLTWIGRGVAEETAGASPASGRRLWAGLAAAGFLAAAALALLYFRRPPASAAAAPVRFTVAAPPSTKFAWIRNQNLFAVSPDGRSIALAARGADGRSSLWIRPLADSNAVPLSDTEGASAPFWSPDSRSVAFFADGKLKKIDVGGGPSVALCDAAPGFPKGSWGSRHAILFHEGGGAGLSVVADGGGTPRTVLKADPSRQESTLGWPEFLPDGRHFLYIVRSGAEKQTYINLASLDGGAPRTVVKDSSRAQYVSSGPAGGPGYILFARDGSLMALPFDDRELRVAGDPIPIGLEVWLHTMTGTGAFSASQNGVLASRGYPSPTRLVWLDRAGRETGSVESPGGFKALDLSSDSRRFVVSKAITRTGRSEVWVGDVSRSVLTKLDLGDDDYEWPVWSPDGSRIALSLGSLRDPPTLSLLSPRTGGVPEKILPSGPLQYTQAWSSDGRFLLYAVRSGAQSGVWVANAEGERDPRLLVTGAFFDAVPYAQFSPDGRWIAFCLAEAGRSEVFLAAFPQPGERIRVSTAGGSRPRWRGDGREIFYVSPDNEMIATPLRPGAEIQVGTPRRLFRIDPSGWQDYDVTGDGERFLVLANVQAPDADAITVTLNWPSRFPTPK